MTQTTKNTALVDSSGEEFTFPCPSCETLFLVGDDNHGTFVTCQRCSRSVLLPMSSRSKLERLERLNNAAKDRNDSARAKRYNGSGEEYLDLQLKVTRKVLLVVACLMLGLTLIETWGISGLSDPQLAQTPVALPFYVFPFFHMGLCLIGITVFVLWEASAAWLLKLIDRPLAGLPGAAMMGFALLFPVLCPIAGWFLLRRLKSHCGQKRLPIMDETTVWAAVSILGFCLMTLALFYRPGGITRPANWLTFLFIDISAGCTLAVSLLYLRHLIRELSRMVFAIELDAADASK